MANHALLSASSSHRWLECTPSARLELEFENSPSVTVVLSVPLRLWVHWRWV